MPEEQGAENKLELCSMTGATSSAYLQASRPPAGSMLALERSQVPVPLGTELSGSYRIMLGTWYVTCRPAWPGHSHRSWRGWKDAGERLERCARELVQGFQQGDCKAEGSDPAAGFLYLTLVQ